jgi:hypothetical protein
MRGLKSIPSAYLFMDGWAAHYNFIRPHEGLGDKTPAEKAGLVSPFKNWLEVANEPTKPSEVTFTGWREVGAFYHRLDST